MKVNYWLILAAYAVFAIYFYNDIVLFLRQRFFSKHQRQKKSLTLEEIKSIIGLSYIMVTISFVISLCLYLFVYKDADTVISLVVLFAAINIFVCLAYAQIEASRKEQARRKRLLDWAKSHGWQYTCERMKNYKHAKFLQKLNKGRNRYLFDVLSGKWHNYPAAAFTFHYETQSYSDSVTHYYFVVVIVYLENLFPRVTIEPRGCFSGGGIKFESIRFSEKFEVRASDLRFAYDICHPRFMQYLLTQIGIDLEINDNMLAAFIDRKELIPQDIEESLEQLVRLRKLMPNYLFRG